MKNKIYFGIIVFISIVLLGCTDNFEKESIVKFYEEHCPSGNIYNYRKIVVINDLGGCMNCNNSFATIMADSLDVEDILFIVSCDGCKVDISPYIEIDRENVIWDKNLDFNELEIVKTCAVIDFKDSLYINELHVK